MQSQIQSDIGSAIDLLNMTLKYMEFKDIEQHIRKLKHTITE